MPLIPFPFSSKTTFSGFISADAIQKIVHLVEFVDIGICKQLVLRASDEPVFARPGRKFLFSWRQHWQLL